MSRHRDGEPLHIAVLMPVHNEATRLVGTLERLRASAREEVRVSVFLVDDGSEPPILPSSLPSPTKNFEITLARHEVNLGQGAALETARLLALDASPFGAYVTMDSDGQHHENDVLALARAIALGADVAFGDRFRGVSNVPLARRVLLRGARLFEWALTGLRLADAHNGLRAFSRRAMGRVTIRQNRMAHATEITQRVSREDTLVVVEVPVSVRYTSETLHKGQPALGAVVILRDLVLQYLFGEP
jgi:glycosyltransferase involved in cell wall biosynthesis